MLWASLLFPDLPIERLGRAVAQADRPAVVVRSSGAKRTIIACNRAARAQRIHAQLTLKGAHALAPELLVIEHDDQAQAEHLRQLALWALGYSSWVSLHPPDTLLVEIQASLSLFGGLEALSLRLRQDAQALNLSLQPGIAPTPSAACLFARIGREQPVTDAGALPGALAPIPVEALALDDFITRGLRQSGIRTLGQMQALPPAALARRFGQSCTDLLYRLDGRLPEPCLALKVPDTFTEALDLPQETRDTTALAFPLQRLFAALGGFLHESDQGVRALQIRLRYHRHATTNLMLQFLDPVADPAHLRRVAMERLANTRLPAGVIRIGLQATETAAIERDRRDLFDTTGAASQGIEPLIDRLTARLGREQLYRLHETDDHRPEKALQQALPGQPTNRPVGGSDDTDGAAASHPARPVWLLRQPVPAREPLTLLTRAERIESGWWDSVDVRRDYFIARNQAGTHFWVYRERSQGERYIIQGLFA